MRAIHSNAGSVYHNNSTCGFVLRILLLHLRSGKNGKTLCGRCKELNKKGQKPQNCHQAGLSKMTVTVTADVNRIGLLEESTPD